jgi:RHS repeat-associated protein
MSENDNGVVTDYIYAEGRPIAVLQPGAATQANQVTYILADHLGTPQLAVNSVGASVWQTTYQPFGTTGNVNASIIQNLRFPGQHIDVETGFNYNLNRDYMPNLGRYVETDPSGIAAGANAYLYAAGGPIVNVDPTGLVSWKQLWQLITGAQKAKTAADDAQSVIVVTEQCHNVAAADNAYSQIPATADDSDKLEAFATQYKNHVNAGGAVFQNVMQNPPYQR